MSRLSPRNMSLRQMLLALVLVGIAGLIVELLLLGHYDSLTQWIPLAMLGAGLASTIAVVMRESRGTVRTFQLVMGMFVLGGALGLYFHLNGNVEWALERNPDLSGMQLVWKALRGAVPALAPGALAQVGLIGLIWSYRHPVLTGRTLEGDSIHKGDMT
jgi:hypothetical protein